MTSDVDISQERLKEWLHYDPETGVFTWLKGVRKGKRAGCVRRDGYLVIRVEYVLYYGHRLAWIYCCGKAPPYIDHEDRDTRNLKFANLRACDQSHNAANSRSTIGRTLPKGVSRVRRTNRFTARLNPRGQVMHLGTFDTVEEAHQAYLRAATEVWGEFAHGGEV